MTPLAFFVPGIPAAQGSMRGFVARNRRTGKPFASITHNSPRVRPWRLEVGWTAQEARLKARAEIEEEGAVAVALVFILPRPKYLRKKATPPHTKKPDTDKLARGVLDALSGVLWRDDSQVASLRARKRYAEPGEQAGVNVIVGDGVVG